jgi:hypothetical protein
LARLQASFGPARNLPRAGGLSGDLQGFLKTSVSFAEHSGLLQDGTMVAKPSRTVKQNMLKNHINLCEIACIFPTLRARLHAVLESQPAGSGASEELEAVLPLADRRQHVHRIA